MITGEKAIAKCHPKDKFNFKKGFEIVYDRLSDNPIEIRDRVKITDDKSLCRVEINESVTE